MQKTDVNNTALMIFFLALGVVVSGGLIAVPILMEAADATNAISSSRDKGARGELMSDGRRQGNGGSGPPTTPGPGGEEGSPYPICFTVQLPGKPERTFCASGQRACEALITVFERQGLGPFLPCPIDD